VAISFLLLCFLLFNLPLLLLVLWDVVDRDGIILLQGIKITDIIVASRGRGVRGIAILVQSIVLLVEDERFNGGILNKAELVVAHALGNAILVVRVGW